MSTALHILVGHQNVVGWRLVLIYIRTLATHCYVESNGRVAYMATHPKFIIIIPLNYDDLWA